jgi:predicted ester cyclase
MDGARRTRVRSVGIPPTAKQLSYAGITIYRVEGGKITEEVCLGDRLGLWQQLGPVPTSRKLAAEIGHG